MTTTNIFGCITTSARTDKDGYAFHGRTRAHIHAWTSANGPVPQGLVLDHWCGNRACCAVHHLEPVTQTENLRRRNIRYRMRIAKCPRGHSLKDNGVITPWNGKVCRQCNRDASDA